MYTQAGRGARVASGLMLDRTVTDTAYRARPPAPCGAPACALRCALGGAPGTELGRLKFYLISSSSTTFHEHDQLCGPSGVW